MILAARIGRVLPTIELARRCTAYGGYTIDDGGQIKGLIYAPFVDFIWKEFSIRAEIATGVAASDIAKLLRGGDLFIASVHPSIRWPDREPPTRGGHLVLVLEATAKAILFHNPSGHKIASQEYVSVPISTFEKFFRSRAPCESIPSSARLQQVHLPEFCQRHPSRPIHAAPSHVTALFRSGHENRASPAPNCQNPC
jgi:hypothetical protein